MTEKEAVQWIITDLNEKIAVVEKSLHLYEKRLADRTITTESRTQAELKILMYKSQYLLYSEKLIAFLKIGKIVEEAFPCELAIVN